jgi:hypothetical protein
MKRAKNKVAQIDLANVGNTSSKRAENASEGRTMGLSIKVSTLLEKCATEAEKRDGADLADFLILGKQQTLRS